MFHIIIRVKPKKYIVNLELGIYRKLNLQEKLTCWPVSSRKMTWVYVYGCITSGCSTIADFGIIKVANISWNINGGA